MTSFNGRPKIKVRYSVYDKIINSLAIILMVWIVFITYKNYVQMPENVPIHFGISGEADRWGSKINFLVLPVVGILMYLLLTVIGYFPYVGNFIVNITEKNAKSQYGLAISMLNFMKLIILVLFSYIQYNVIDIAYGNETSMNGWIMAFFMIIIIGNVIIYTVKSIMNK